MQNRNNLARLGGIIAVLSLLFLPLASCGEARIAGTDLLFDVEGSLGHKAILAIALIAAVIAVIATKAWMQFTSGIAGLLAIGVEYLFTQKDSSGAIQLLQGSYVAMVGFALVLIAGLMGRREKT